MILQLAPDGRVKVVAGRPLHCPSPLGGYHSELATHATLVMPQSIAFGPSGDLYVAESDSQRINRVRVIGKYHFLSTIIESDAKLRRQRRCMSIIGRFVDVQSKLRSGRSSFLYQCS